MQNIILFDTDVREALLPFTHTRPVCELRVGVLTIREKWSALLGEVSFSHITSEHLESQFPIDINEDNYLINGAALPTESLRDQIRRLESGEALMLADELIAARLSKEKFEKLIVMQDLDDLVGYEIDKEDVELLESILGITDVSSAQISSDMGLLGLLKSQYPEGLKISGEHPVYIEESARVEQVYINAEDGPVYVGAHAHLMDGARLRGPVSIGEKTIVKSHAFLSKGVCIGPLCEVGGEIKHSVFLGSSNKSHEGYIGDSVIGEYCNLGALTTNSNLRNSFTDVGVWSYLQSRIEPSGKNKCGFFMGDYCRTAILTKINSGTVIGVSCHLFGEGTAKGFIPSFTWGGLESHEEYDLIKAIRAAAIFRSWKETEMNEVQEELWSQLFRLTAIHRDDIS